MTPIPPMPAPPMPARERTRTLLVLPPARPRKADVARAIRRVEERFGAAGVDIAAPVDWMAYYAPLVDGRPLRPFDPIGASGRHDVLVFAEGPLKEFSHWPLTDACFSGCRVYELTMWTRLHLIRPERFDAEEAPWRDAHVFSRLSGGRRGYANFPYGPLHYDPEVGPVHPLGFRIPEELSGIAARPADRTLIAVFGGSAAFSYYCTPEEMFPALLEARLNAHCVRHGLPNRFTVLNFGMHDHVVIQEMLTYLLFVQPLRPDVVIAHDAHNDLYYGLQDDPYLLNRWSIIYQRYSEEWSKLLHDRSGEITPPLYSTSADTHETNPPDGILNAYLSRKRQFEQVVTASGARFVWGVQPVHASKKALSPGEQALYRQCEAGYAPNPAKAKFMKRLYALYDMLSDRIAEANTVPVVDFHRLFKAYDERHELLWDHCHTSPAGDAVIADGYFDRLVRELGLMPSPVSGESHA